MSWLRRVLILRISRFVERVPKSGNGADRYPRRFEFLAQAVDIDLDRVRAHLLIPPVELFGELFLVDDASAPVQQHLQDTELAGGKIERRAVERRAPACGVELERTMDERRAAAGLPA